MSKEDTMKDAAAAALEESVTPLDKVKNYCLSQGYGGILAFGKEFRIMDEDGTGTISFDEASRGIKLMNLKLSDSEIADLLKDFDPAGDGKIDYEQFITALRPAMTPARLAVVGKVFAMLDTSGDGVITIDDIRAKYSAANHPSVLDGSETEDQVLDRFLARFEGNSTEAGKLTKQEFTDYYSGISKSIDGDDYFVEMVQQSWGLK